MAFTMNEFRQAARYGDIEKVKKGIRLKSIKIDQPDQGGNTALRFAVGNNQSEVVELLCAAGADIPYNMVNHSLTHNNIDIVKTLRQYGEPDKVMVVDTQTIKEMFSNTAVDTLEYVYKNNYTMNFTVSELVSHVMMNNLKLSLETAKIFVREYGKEIAADNNKLVKKWLLTRDVSWMPDADKYDTVKKYIINSMEVQRVAVENADDTLLPDTVKDLFLF